MRLCEEYLARMGVDVEYAVHVRKGFLYFSGGERLLSIVWNDPGPHPGFYEFSESVLERRCRTLSTERVEWDEYESRLISWRSSAAGLVLDRGLVFDLTWRYFIRRYESLLLGIFPLSVLHSTIDRSNSSRLSDCMGVLETLAVRAPDASEFWHSRAFDIVSLYCPWIDRL